MCNFVYDVDDVRRYLPPGISVDLPTVGQYYVVLGRGGLWQTADNVVLTISPPVRPSHRAADQSLGRAEGRVLEVPLVIRRAELRDTAHLTLSSQ